MPAGLKSLQTDRSTLIALSIAVIQNIGFALLAFFLLGNPAAWLAGDRFDRDVLIAYGLPFAQFLAIAYLIDCLISMLFKRAARQKTGKRTPRLAVQLTRLFVYFCVCSASVSWVFNKSISGILAASGVVGLVLGFALRGLVLDLFSGIALHLDHNLAVGDWIDFSYRGHDYSGEIRDIHWRCVILADRDDNVLMIPNGEFSGLAITNRSRPNEASTYVTTIALGNEHSPDRVVPILEMVLSNLVGLRTILATPAPWVRIGNFENGVLSYRLHYSVIADRRAHLLAQSAVYGTAVKFLRLSGIYLYPLYPNYTNPEKLPPDRAESREVRLRVLSTVLLLRVLSPKELELVAEQAAVLRVANGDTLMRAGEEDSRMAVVAEGSFEVLIDSPQGLKVVNTLWPGDCAGEMSLLTGERRSATVRARTPACVLIIDKPIMEHLLVANPNLVQALAQLAGRRQKQREDMLAYAPVPSLELDKSLSITDRIRNFFGLA